MVKILHNPKLFTTFATESYAGGKYVLRKVFRNGSFLGRFRTYLNSVYCALRLTNRKLRNFSNKTVKIKVTVNAYGYDYIHTTLIFRRSVLSYRRRFPVVYLTVWVMRRPLLVNNQRRSTLFCVYIPIAIKKQQYY